MCPREVEDRRVLRGQGRPGGRHDQNDHWQSLWTCAAYMLLAVTLWRARA